MRGDRTNEAVGREDVPTLGNECLLSIIEGINEKGASS